MIPDSFSDKNICIVGLGYVGLTLGVAMAAAGFNVYGVEISDVVIDALKQKMAHFNEKGLDSLLANQIDNGTFRFGRQIAPDFAATVYIITVGTPVGENKRTKVAGLEAVLNSIVSLLCDGDLVVLRSTVRIGTTRTIAKPALDAAGKRYDLAFCPERTLEGRALQELPTLPQIVGGIDHQSTFRAAQLFSFLTPSVIRVNDAETAEMIKLVNNTQRDYLFAFANEVAFMCETVGIAAAEVIRAANLGYARSHMPLPGPVGGPCLEKDPYILAEGLEAKGFRPELALAARRWNEALPEMVVNSLVDAFAKKGVTPPRRLAVLGLAFKGRPATDDLRGSMAYPLIKALRLAFPEAEIVGWDPVARSGHLGSFGIHIEESIEAACSDAGLVLIQNNHEAFEAMDLKHLSSLMCNNSVLYDFWNQHDPRKAILAPTVKYWALGSSNITNLESHEK